MIEILNNHIGDIQNILLLIAIVLVFSGGYNNSLRKRMGFIIIVHIALAIDIAILDIVGALILTCTSYISVKAYFKLKEIKANGGNTLE